jgi:hypothetical protein
VFDAASNALNPTAKAAGTASDSHLEKAREYAGKSGHEAKDSANYLAEAGKETGRAAQDAAGRTAQR